MVDTDTAEGAAAAHLVPTATPTTDRPSFTARTIDRAATAIPTTDPPTTTAPTTAHASPTVASIAHGYMAGVVGAGAGAVGVGADGGAGSLFQPVAGTVAVGWRVMPSSEGATHRP